MSRDTKPIKALAGYFTRIPDTWPKPNPDFTMPPSRQAFIFSLQQPFEYTQDRTQRGVE